MIDFFKIWYDLGFNCVFLEKTNHFYNIFQDSKSYERIFIITDNTKNDIINYSSINKVLFQRIYHKIEDSKISNVKYILEKLIDTLEKDMDSIRTRVKNYLGEIRMRESFVKWLEDETKRVSVKLYK